MVAPGMPMGKWTQVDAIGIMELVFAGKIDRVAMAGPINDIAPTITNIGFAKHTTASPSISRHAGKITDNGGGMISMNAGVIKLN